MSIKLTIGTYEFNRVDILNVKQSKSPSQRVETWDITGHIDQPGFVAIKAELDVLEANAFKDGLDIELFDNDGGGTELLKIDASDPKLLPGYPQVRSLEHPQSSEDGSWRETLICRLQVTAIFSIRIDANVIALNETTSLKRQVLNQKPREVIGGSTNPIIQPTTLSAVTATQSGRAVGRSSYPSAGTKLFTSGVLISDTETKEDPKIQPDGSFTEFAISWNYEYLFDSDPTHDDPNTQPL